MVVDLETTGGSPVDDAITEIGAVRFEGAERVGTFQTLVDPERPIPPAITHLTGISDRAVAGAPSLATVMPSFLEFARGAVIVAHNASFDFGFLNANLLRLEYPTLPSPAVCTAKLARRLVWPEVPNVRLRTLASYFRTRVQPNHRAFARRRSHRRGAARTPRRRRAARHPHARRAVPRLQRAGAAELREDRARRGAAPRARGLPLPRPQRADAVRGQVEGRARPREVLFLRRRAQEDAGPLASVTRIDAVRDCGGELEALVLEAGSSAATSRGTTRAARPGAATPT